jgi:hypothetical protein
LCILTGEKAFFPKKWLITAIHLQLVICVQMVCQEKKTVILAVSIGLIEKECYFCS